GEHQFGIAQLQELLSAEPPHVRIHDHRPDTHLIHVLEPRLSVVCARVHFLIALRPVHHIAHTGGGAQPRIGNALITEVPPQASLSIGIDTRYRITHVGGHPTGPEIWRLGDMGVYVHDCITAHSTPPLAA